MPASEPAGTKPRNYRILAFDEANPETIDDYGFHPGREPDAAIKHAEKAHAPLRLEDKVVVPIPESAWRPQKRTVEMVEQVRYKAWVYTDEPAQAALDA